MVLYTVIPALRRRLKHMDLVFEDSLSYTIETFTSIKQNRQGLAVYAFNTSTRRLKQVGLYEFMTSLVCIVSCTPTKATQYAPVLKQNKTSKMKQKNARVWWYTPLISALCDRGRQTSVRRQRQVVQFNNSLIYVVNSRIARAMQKRPLFKQKQAKQKTNSK